MYFAACTSINEFTVDKSATPIITKGAWKIRVPADANNEFAGYNFVFVTTGELKVSKNGVNTKGNWSEDNISKRITINLGETDPILAKLNDYWNIKDIVNAQVNLENSHDHNGGQLKITSL